MRDMKVKSRRRKWLWRGVAAGVLVLAVAAAVPFVVPTATVRYMLGRTALGRMPLTFGSATLSPLGTLTLRDVVLEDSGKVPGKPLATASAVRVEFSWWQLASSRVSLIAVEGADVRLRPGDAPEETWEQWFPPDDKTTAGGKPVTGGGGGFQVDRLSVQGRVRLEGGTPWLRAFQLPAGTELRLDGRMTMSGKRDEPLREFMLVVGEVDPQAVLPGAVAKGRYEAGAAPVLTLETLALSNLSPTIGAEMLERWVPEPLRREFRGRLDRVQVGGKIIFGAETLVSLTADLQDLSLAAAASGGSALTGSESAGGALGVEHLSVSTRLEGRWNGTATMWRDLMIAPALISWESLQAGPVRITRCAAKVESDGMEVALNDLQATVGEATLAVTAAYDLNARTFSRGRVWLNGIDAARTVARLPAGWQAYVPGQVEGILNARLFLQEYDADHVMARVEVSSRDGFGLVNAPPRLAPAALSSTPPPPGGSAVQAAAPRAPLAAQQGMARGAEDPGDQEVEDHYNRLAWLSNLSVGANVMWNLRLDSLPEVTRGRLTAERMEIMPPDGSPALTAVRIISDFGMIRGMARLSDLYANFADGATLAAQATYVVNSQTLQRARISLLNLDGSLITPWLPGEWGLTGKFDTEVQVSLGYEARGGMRTDVTGSVALSQESSVQYGKAVLAINGAPTADAPAPSVAFKVSAALDEDRGLQVVEVESLSPRGFGAFRMDGANVDRLREALAPSADSVTAEVLERIQGGASLSFEEMTLSGRVELGEDPRATGSLRLTGLSFNAPRQEEQEWAVAGVHVHGTATAPLAGDWLTGLRITDATVQAQRLTAGKRTVTGLTARLSAEGGKGAATDVAFGFAEGAFTGTLGVALTPSPQVESVRLGFKGLDQAVVMAALHPDYFTAEGPISGEIVLGREGGAAAGGGRALAGTIQFVTDGPGTLKFSRETVSQVFGPKVKEAMSQPGTLVPENVDEILLGQFANFRYVSGRVEIRDGARGLDIHMSYQRRPLEPGDPGYAVPVEVAGQRVLATVPFGLPGFTVTVNDSIENLLRKAMGFQTLLLGAGGAGGGAIEGPEGAGTRPRDP